jgi:hypothetical protein
MPSRSQKKNAAPLRALPFFTPDPFVAPTGAEGRGNGRFLSPTRFCLTRPWTICNGIVEMKRFSTNEAARKLGIDPGTLSRYIKTKKLPSPEIVAVGTATLHIWTEADIERARKLLPKIANGRKTRYQKLREKKGAPAGVPVPHKKKQTKKKK